jgi:hypothetical protein
MHSGKKCVLEFPATIGFMPSTGIRNSFGTIGKSVRPSIGEMPRQMMWPISIKSFADAPSQPLILGLLLIEPPCWRPALAAPLRLTVVERFTTPRHRHKALRYFGKALPI